MISVDQNIATPWLSDRPATDEANASRVRAAVMQKHDIRSATTAVTTINPTSPAHKKAFAGLWLGEGEAIASAA
jgi:hypothetical protein